MVRHALILIGLLFQSAPSRASEETLMLMIKPSDVSLPDGVLPGKYRRIIQPFPNWTLICDENLQEKTRVCNVTQTIVDQSGRTVFSWSVAATRGGSPYMILRTLAGLGPAGRVKLILPDERAPVDVRVEECDAKICLAKVPIGPRLRPQIAKGGVVGVSYETTSGEKVELAAPLEGIDEAVAAIE